MENSTYLTIPDMTCSLPKMSQESNKFLLTANSTKDLHHVGGFIEEDSQGSGSGTSSAALKPAITQWCKLVTAISTGTMSNSPKPQKKEVDFQGQAFIKRYSAYSVSFPQHLQEKYEDLYRRGSRGSVLGKVEKRCFPRRHVLNHDSSILFYWLSILAFIIFYNWWSIIVREAFPLLQKRYTVVWACTDTVADIFFIVDIIVQLRTGYLQEGMLVISTKKLIRKYMCSTNFVIDTLSLVPLEYVYLGITGDYHPIARFNRLFKIYRVLTLYYMTETRTVYPNLNRVGTLTHILILSCHWLACIYHMIAPDKLPLQKDADMDILEQYLYALYWSTLTLTTIGNNTLPTTKWEYVFSIISYLFGVFVFATIVGQVGNVINNRNASRLQFERLLDGAKHYMRNHRVPKEMHTRVLRWYDYAWSRGRMTGGTDIDSLSVLPEKLKMELALHVNISTLKKVTIFEDCEPEFLRDLVLKMRAMIFTPGDFVCRKGEIAREMYIIADGVLHVLDEWGNLLREMRSGEVFGEIGVLNLGCNFCKRTADVRSVGYSEMFCLSREDILSVLEDYPNAEKCLRMHGNKRLNGQAEDTVVTPTVTISQNDSDGALKLKAESLSRKQRASFQSTISRSLDEQLPSEKHLDSMNSTVGLTDHHRSGSFRLSCRRSCRKHIAPAPVTNLLGCRILDQDNSLDFVDSEWVNDNQVHAHGRCTCNEEYTPHAPKDLGDVFRRLHLLVDHKHHQQLECEMELISQAFQANQNSPEHQTIDEDILWNKPNNMSTLESSIVV